MGRRISLLFFFLAALLAAASFFLAPAHLRQLALLLSQTGSLHPALMEKVELVPRLLFLASIELGLAALWWEFRGKKHLPAWQSDFCRRPVSRQALFSVGLLYLLISLFSLNFYGVSLVSRWRNNARSSQSALPAGLPAEWGPVFLAIRQNTPASARILIKTGQDEKYLLNYLCYPRRFYFYPERDKPLAAIPPPWLQRHKIEWMLDIPADPARGYSLQPVSTSEGGHP